MIPGFRVTGSYQPYRVGLRNVGSYQVSGHPFITGSNFDNSLNQILQGAEKKVEFPYVTKSIKLWNHSTDLNSKLRFHLVSSSSINNHPTSKHFMELGYGESLNINLKCSSIWMSALSGDVKWKIYASLTNIPVTSMYALTGSGISS